MRVRILIAEDHTIVRQSLRTRLEAEPDFDLVGEAKDGLLTLAQVEKLRPDVVLLDLGMPGLNGIDVLARVRQGFPRTRVVVLSMHEDPSYVVRAFQNGASAYVTKSADAKDLVRAVHEAMAGRHYLSPPFSEADLDEYMKKAANGDTDPYNLLTRREREVLQLVVEGNTNPLVAKRLFIDTRTVETHRAHVMEKLGLKNLAELVRFAVARHLLDADRAMEIDRPAASPEANGGALRPAPEAAAAPPPPGIGAAAAAPDVAAPPTPGPGMAPPAPGPDAQLPAGDPKADLV